MSTFSLSTNDELLDATSSDAAAMDVGDESSKTPMNSVDHDESSRRTIIRVDDSAIIDSLVSIAVAALEITQQPGNLLQRIPKELREKIWEHHFFNCTGIAMHPKREIKPLLKALKICPTLYQEVIEFYFDQYYMTVTLGGWSPFLHTIRPETMASLSNLAIFSDNELWGHPRQYKQKLLYSPWQPEHPPSVSYPVKPELQIHHALNLRILFLSITPHEPFILPFLAKLLRPSPTPTTPTPLRTLKLNIQIYDETPPDKDGDEANRLSWEIFTFVEERLRGMYARDSVFSWRLKRDWSGAGRRWPRKVFCTDSWRLWEAEKKMGDGPVVAGTRLVDLVEDDDRM